MDDGDYYNTSGQKIGTDGINDGKKYNAISTTAPTDIAAQTAKGQNVTLSDADKAGVIPNPTKKEVSEMNNLCAKTESDAGKENGFEVATDKNGNQITLRDKVGDQSKIDHADARATLKADERISWWVIKLRLKIFSHRKQLIRQLPILVNEYN
jgi:hypothetical protein